MERKDSQEELKRQAIQQEQNAEHIHEIDQLAFNFQKKYFEVSEGKKMSEDLYSGDFAYCEEPEKLIVQNSNGKILKVEYDEVLERFMGILEKDLLDEEPSIDVFKREPEPRTEYLRNFLKFHEGKPLIDFQTVRKLRTTEPNTVLTIAVDRYFRIDGSDTPFSETWTIRKMKFDESEDKKGEVGKAIKIKPRSMVAAMSLPGAPLG